MENNLDLKQSQIEQWVAEEATGAFNYTKVMDGQIPPNLYPHLRTILKRLKEKGVVYPVPSRGDGWWRPADNTLEELQWWESGEIEGDNLILPLNINNFCIIPRPSMVVIAGKYNAGKALRNGTPVLTPDGWVNIEDIKFGDTVYTQQGNESAVIGVFPQGYRKCYRFTFNDGCFIDSDGEHLWQVMTYTNRIFRKTGHGNDNTHFRGWTNKTTGDIVASYGIGNIIPRHKIMFPSADPVKLPHKDVSLDPYVLGLLLGDGSFKESSIIYTTSDDELVESIKQSGMDFVKTRNYEYRIRKLTGIIDGLGLHHKRSHEKFIPASYLFNSVDVRLAILQGLMDTDGTINKTGKYIEFTSVSEQLAHDVMFLVRSLGGRASVHTANSSYQSKGIKVDCKLNYRVSIKFETIKPFRLKTKLDRCSAHTKTSNRILCCIDDIGIDKTTCIKILDSSGLFVTKDFIATHNSAFCLNTVALNQDKWGGYLDFYVSEGAEMIKPKFAKLGITDAPAFRTYHRTENFADVIKPDNLSVIDYLRVDMEQSYAVSAKLFEIFNKLKTGIAVVAMQKPPGERKLAFGGASTAFEPALYIGMESNGSNKGWIGFEKIKIPRLYGGCDINVAKIEYRIKAGVEFYDIIEKLNGDFTQS